MKLMVAAIVDQFLLKNQIGEMGAGPSQKASDPVQNGERQIENELESGDVIAAKESNFFTGSLFSIKPISKPVKNCFPAV